MTVEALSDTAKIAIAADWVEMAALLSPRQTASNADLVRSIAPLQENDHGVVPLSDEDEEPVEEEILESESESWVSDVREELAARRSALGASYPFAIHQSGQVWRLSLAEETGRHDHLMYVCCLLITARRYGLVKQNVPEMDKVLQVVSYLVAAQVVQGKAYWFGYPRPGGSGTMSQAINKLLIAMGFPAPILTPPVWSTGAENDGGIDIVAWRSFGDGLPARIVLYGQVASGKNWEGKPVTHYTETTWPSWVGDYGQKYYFPALFIPWPQYITVESINGRSFRQRVLDTSMKNERFYGLTVDRGRIAELARRTTATGNGDEEGWIVYLSDWRERVLKMLMV